MKCIVHIGTEKTATTSFQRYMHTHRDAALAQGIWYPRSMGGHWHRHLAVYAMSPSRPDEAFRALGIRTGADHAQFRRKLEAQFAAERAEAASARYCVISSEHLHSRLRSVDEVEQVRAFLAPHFSEIQIVVSLRPQVDLLVSLASTAARSNKIVNRQYFQTAASNRNYFDYDAFLRKWENVFDHDKITAIPFKKQNDLRTVLTGQTSCDLNTFGNLGDFNSSLDVQVIAMINSAKRAGAKAKDFASIVNLLPMKEKICVSEAMAREIDSAFSEGNARLADRYPNISLSDLTPDFASFPQTDNLDILDMPCAFPDALANMLDAANTLARKQQRRAQA